MCLKKTEIEPTAWRKKAPIPLDGIRTCTPGIRAHRYSDYTTRAGTPHVSRNKHFRHSPPAPSWNTSMHNETLQVLSAGPRLPPGVCKDLRWVWRAMSKKDEDRSNGMSEKSAHFPWRDSNLYLLDTRPSCFWLHQESRNASRQSKQIPQTLTHQLHRETQACVTKHSNSHPSPAMKVKVS